MHMPRDSIPVLKVLLLKCLYFMQLVTGAARYDYTHEIRNCDLATQRRISLTFRQSVLTEE